jgi:hypothetical protein
MTEQIIRKHARDCDESIKRTGTLPLNIISLTRFYDKKIPKSVRTSISQITENSDTYIINFNKTTDFVKFNNDEFNCKAEIRVCKNITGKRSISHICHTTNGHVTFEITATEVINYLKTKNF